MDKEKLFREWKRKRKKYEREIQHVNFLNDCVHFDIIPNCLKIKNKWLNKEFKREIEKCERIILRKMIRRKYMLIEKLRNRVEEDRRRYSDMFGDLEVERDQKRIDVFRIRERGRYIERHRKKLRFWIERKDEIMVKKPTEIPYINLSEKRFNEHQDSVLKLGPKHILDENIDLRETIPRVETAMEKIPAEFRPIVRMKYQEEIEKRIREGNRDVEDRRVLTAIKRDTEIACIHSDKTGKIVIMQRDNYNSMMEETIRKLEASEINSDPNKKLMKIVDNLIKEDSWPENKKPKLLNFAPNTPRIFGRLKDHKDPFTIRPIVNKKEAPTYSLEKYMKNIYREILTESETTLQSTEDFIKRFREIDIEKDEILVSFDVENLYPSINKEEIPQFINNEIIKKRKV